MKNRYFLLALLIYLLPFIVYWLGGGELVRCPKLENYAVASAFIGTIALIVLILLKAFIADEEKICKLYHE